MIVFLLGVVCTAARDRRSRPIRFRTRSTRGRGHRAWKPSTAPGCAGSANEFGGRYQGDLVDKLSEGHNLVHRILLSRRCWSPLVACVPPSTVGTRPVARNAFSALGDVVTKQGSRPV